MCDGQKVRHAWIYGGMCEIRPPVYTTPSHASECVPPLNQRGVTLACGPVVEGVGESHFEKA